MEHQPFGSLLCREILATGLRVQCSLIISTHVLPEKIVGSLVPEKIQDSKSSSYLAKNFRSELPFQIVATEELWRCSLESLTVY